MKKIISLLIFLIIACTNSVFAIEDKKLVSDSDKQQELMKSFNEVHHPGDSLFSQQNSLQKAIERQKKEDNAGHEVIVNTNRVHIPNTLTPIKRIRLHLKEKSNKEKIEDNIKEAEATILPENEQVILDCENLEYFTERTELEATGNVAMRFPQNDSKLEADKIIYNQTTNKITAIGNVVITKGSNIMTGDYLVVNMNEENALFENPNTEIGQIHARAKVGYVYGDDVIQEQGSIYITKKTMLSMRNTEYGPYLETMVVKDKNKSQLMDESFGSKLKIKVSDIIINSKKEHDTITVKKADIFFNNKKIGFIPAMTVHTNKNRDYVVIDNPEIGTITDLGLYAGPGFVFDTPHGSVLKLIPFFNYQSGGDRGSVGVGGFAKFRSATNVTDIAYGTANNVLLAKGIQYLDDNLYLQYGANRYVDDWFMGARKARMMGELVYQDSISHKNFLAKKLDMNFSHRFAVGYMQDGPNNEGIGLFSDEGVGTLRTKYMAEIRQTVFKINDELKDDVNARFDIVGQGAFALYGTGDTQALARFGPRFHHQYKRWMSDIAYLVSGVSDGTPMKSYDSYVYGGSNVSLRESLRISKYLTLSWLTSFNLSYNQEKYRNSNMKLMPENSLFLAIGPDDLRLHIGYDFARQQSYVYMTMDLDAKGTVVDYEKMIVKNPDNFNKKPKEILYVNNVPAQNDGSQARIQEPKIERAEVTDIVNDERL